ncbi:MAG: hypothetical protein Kow0069_28820 [Promethearchaeota archaeon]
MNAETLEFDFVVAGGGFGGVCAAIAAARRGLKTALVQDRPVLGGNASSEVRVHVGGATAQGYHYDARESGIVEEIRLDLAVRDPLNEYFWVDHVLYTYCVSEPNLRLFLNARVHAAKVVGRRVVSVTALQTSTGRTFEFRAKFFADATGDGVVAHLAGATCRVGREAKSEFGESLAPDVADDHVLGSSILFRAEDVGRPVRFDPVPWAKRFTAEQLRAWGHHGGLRKHPNHGKYWHADSVGWWWIEVGGLGDTIRDEEEVRHELQAIVFGLWDYVKNHDPRTREAAMNFELTWVGQVPGKRESRRVVGDYLLTQDDVLSARIFEDQVAVGGWSVDLHPPAGFYHEGPSATHAHGPAPYSIPYRCTYSKDLDNLFLASRCLSVTHVAHASTRLIATLACVGQAVGTAAALCVAHDCTARELASSHLRELQQALLRNDGYLLGVKNEDPHDLALGARASATSEHPCRFGEPDEFVDLYFPVAQRFHVPPRTPGGRQTRVFALLRNEGGSDVVVRGGLRRDPSRLGLEFTAVDDLARLSGRVPAGSEGWVELVATPRADFSRGGNYWIYLEEADGVAWGHSRRHWPGFRRGYREEDSNWWKVVRPGGSPFFDGVLGPRGTFCFAVEGVPSPFPAAAATNGYARPFGAPNLWVSAPNEAGGAEELTVWFAQPRVLSEVLLTFDTDLDKPFPHQGYGWEREYKAWPAGGGKAPCCVKDFDVYLLPGRPEVASRSLVSSTRGNYQRRVRVAVDPPRRAAGVAISCLAAWGAPTRSIYEVRAYPDVGKT